MVMRPLPLADNQQFLANINCSVLLLMHYLRDKVGLERTGEEARREGGLWLGTLWEEEAECTSSAQGQGIWTVPETGAWAAHGLWC